MRERLLELALLNPRDLRAWVELSRHDMRRGRPDGGVLLAEVVLPHVLDPELCEILSRSDVCLWLGDRWQAALAAGYLTLGVWGVPVAACASVGRVLFPLKMSAFYAKK